MNYNNLSKNFVIFICKRFVAKVKTREGASNEEGVKTFIIKNENEESSCKNRIENNRNLIYKRLLYTISFNLLWCLWSHQTIYLFKTQSKALKKDHKLKFYETTNSTSEFLDVKKFFLGLKCEKFTFNFCFVSVLIILRKIVNWVNFQNLFRFL